MSIDFLPERFARVTQTDVVGPVYGRLDLLDPSTGRTLIPALVQLHLRRTEGAPSGDREYAMVSVSGPRRLKSGSEGRQITCFGWEKARNSGARAVVDRPEWLTLTICGLLPEGWSLSLVDMGDEEPAR
ncbi:hypothetical protein [Streptomyces achromogenes]|uniref:hypothetical protein n=1 Tax=Streptomyces achromogenes TaxID=67255 RepID=UPI00342109D8